MIARNKGTANIGSPLRPLMDRASTARLTVNRSPTNVIEDIDSLRRPPWPAAVAASEGSRSVIEAMAPPLGDFPVLRPLDRAIVGPKVILVRFRLASGHIFQLFEGS